MDDVSLWREIVIFVFTLWLSVFLGFKLYVHIKGKDTKILTVIVLVILFLIHIWTWIWILSVWVNETLVNPAVPLSAFPFWNSVIDGVILYFGNLSDWVQRR